MHYPIPTVFQLSQQPCCLTLHPPSTHLDQLAHPQGPDGLHNVTRQVGAERSHQIASEGRAHAQDNVWGRKMAVAVAEAEQEEDNQGEQNMFTGSAI